MAMSPDQEYEYRVWHFVARECGHPSTTGHGPSDKGATFDVETFGGCSTCGPETTVLVEVRCLCGERLERESRPWNFDEVMRGIFAVPLHPQAEPSESRG